MRQHGPSYPKPIDCLIETATGQVTSKSPDGKVMTVVRDQTAAILDHTSLADIDRKMVSIWVTPVPKSVAVFAGEPDVVRGAAAHALARCESQRHLRA